MITKKTPCVLLPLGFNLDKSYDLQAVMEGRASPEQQISAMKYIMEDLCGHNGEPTDLDSPNATYYNLGRRNIAVSMSTIYKFNLAELKQRLPKEK